MNGSANLPAERRPLAPIEVLKTTVARKADDFKMVLPSHITVDKFQRTIATAALSNPKLLECDRQSLLIACMKLAQDGLLPDGREAALVPFSTRVKDANGQWSTVWQVQAMPMAFGLRKKVLQSGEVISLQVGVVYAAEIASGNFLYEIGIEPPIRHRPKLDMTEEEMADDQLVAAYSIARIKSDTGEPYWSVEVMRRAEVLKVRQMSQTGALNRTDRQGKPISPKGPWVDWEPEMWKKTVLRRHTKVLPMSGDILDTLERDDAEEARAAGAARLLETETAAPVVLPPHDPDTGELIEDRSGTSAGVPLETEERREPQRDNRGMSEVSEEVARELDEQGRTDEQHGDQHSEAEPEKVEETIAEIDEAEVPMWRKAADTALANAAAAKNPRGIEAVDREWCNARAAVEQFDQALVQQVDAFINDRRRAIRAAAAKEG